MKTLIASPEGAIAMPARSMAAYAALIHRVRSGERTRTCLKSARSTPSPNQNGSGFRMKMT